MSTEYDDIYDDLDNFDVGKSIDELQEKNTTLTSRISELETSLLNVTREVEEVKKVNITLQYNISKLYYTAKADFDRKNRIISELREELDNLKFRRIGNHRIKRKFDEPNEYSEVQPAKKSKINETDNLKNDTEYPKPTKDKIEYKNDKKDHDNNHNRNYKRNQHRFRRSRSRSDSKERLRRSPIRGRYSDKHRLDRVDNRRNRTRQHDKNRRYSPERNKNENQRRHTPEKEQKCDVKQEWINHVDRFQKKENSDYDSISINSTSSHDSFSECLKKLKVKVHKKIEREHLKDHENIKTEIKKDSPTEEKLGIKNETKNEKQKTDLANQPNVVKSKEVKQYVTEVIIEPDVKDILNIIDSDVEEGEVSEESSSPRKKLQKPLLVQNENINDNTKYCEKHKETIPVEINPESIKSEDVSKINLDIPKYHEIINSEEEDIVNINSIIQESIGSKNQITLLPEEDKICATPKFSSKKDTKGNKTRKISPRKKRSSLGSENIKKKLICSIENSDEEKSHKIKGSKEQLSRPQHVSDKQLDTKVEKRTGNKKLDKKHDLEPKTENKNPKDRKGEISNDKIQHDSKKHDTKIKNKNTDKSKYNKEHDLELKTENNEKNSNDQLFENKLTKNDHGKHNEKHDLEVKSNEKERNTANFETFEYNLPETKNLVRNDDRKQEPYSEKIKLGRNVKTGCFQIISEHKNDLQIQDKQGKINEQKKEKTVDSAKEIKSENNTVQTKLGLNVERKTEKQNISNCEEKIINTIPRTENLEIKQNQTNNYELKTTSESEIQKINVVSKCSLKKIEDVVCNIRNRNIKELKEQNSSQSSQIQELIEINPVDNQGTQNEPCRINTSNLKQLEEQNISQISQIQASIEIKSENRILNLDSSIDIEKLAEEIKIKKEILAELTQNEIPTLIKKEPEEIIAVCPNMSTVLCPKMELVSPKTEPLLLKSESTFVQTVNENILNGVTSNPPEEKKRRPPRRRAIITIK